MNKSFLPENPQPSAGRITTRDKRKALILSWLPWVAQLLVSVPLPLIFLILFISSTATDSAAIYFLLFFVSLGLGLVVGFILLIVLLLYRRRWHKELRNRLAANGITAGEINWFESELSAQERMTLRELETSNPLLADAYCETLAARLNATRITVRAREEVLRINRQINRTRALKNTDTGPLLAELVADRQRVQTLWEEANSRLSATKGRLQMIEVAADRTLPQRETEMMLQRLISSQEHFPLALEMAKLEKEALLDLTEENLSDF